jgi:hypothetical protein
MNCHIADLQKRDSEAYWIGAYGDKLNCIATCLVDKSRANENRPRFLERVFPVVRTIKSCSSEKVSILSCKLKLRASILLFLTEYNTKQTLY